MRHGARAPLLLGYGLTISTWYNFSAPVALRSVMVRSAPASLGALPVMGVQTRFDAGRQA